jgi:hypothetical protein
MFVTVETKICSKCGIEKNICEYHVNNFGKSGYHSQCKKCKNNYKKTYNQINKNKRREYRLKNKHVGLWRSVLKSSLSRLNTKKESKTIDLLGYSALDLKNHLESLFTEGMTWENHGEWHVDHIKPVSSFKTTEHPSVVNALSNLRPIWSTTRVLNGVEYIGNLNRNKIRRKKL